jgi:hypothetical protein
MKKSYFYFLFMFVVLTPRVFAETWIVTDSGGNMQEWNKESGKIPLEYFSFACIKGCTGVGNGIMHTTSDNYTTFDVDFYTPSGGSASTCHNIYIGKKEKDNVNGDFLCVCSGTPAYGYDGTWYAVISDGDGNKLLVKEKMEKNLVGENKENN